jgi:hypothetical protein
MILTFDSRRLRRFSGGIHILLLAPTLPKNPCFHGVTWAIVRAHLKEREPWGQLNEADTCRNDVLQKLTGAHWDDGSQYLTEQRTFTDGRIVPTSNRATQKRQRRADYLLGYRVPLCQPCSKIRQQAHQRSRK